MPTSCSANIHSFCYRVVDHHITVMVLQIYTLLEERYYTHQSQQQERSLIVRNCSCCPSICARLLGWKHNRRAKWGRVRTFQKSTIWNLVSKLCVFRRKRHYCVSKRAKPNKSLPLYAKKQLCKQPLNCAHNLNCWLSSFLILLSACVGFEKLYTSASASGPSW